MTRRTGVAVAALTVLVFALGGSAAAVSEEDRAAGLKEQRSAVTPAPVAGVATNGQCWSWPANTTVNLFTFAPEPFPRADIVEFCADYQGDRLTTRLRVAQPTNPLTDTNWLGLTGALWGLDHTGNGDDDHTITYLRDGSQIAVLVSDAADDTTCQTTGTYSGGFYVAEVQASCFGAPSDTRLDAFMLYDSDPTNPDAPLYGDLTDRQTVRRQTAAPGPQPSRSTGRLGGRNRVETAIEISGHAFPDGASEVYLARQDAFPDALAGGGLSLGPVLLVPQCGTLPDAVYREIQRLDPDTVLALGGTAAVCDDILRQAGR
jgi:hypothetical protein